MPIDPKKLAAMQDVVTPRVETLSLKSDDIDTLLGLVADQALAHGEQWDDLYNELASARTSAAMTARKVGA
jgi:hypothetical protein